ncbi:efflux transporter outer membrane subunit [Nitrosomonas sp. Nm58]|uniref:efflux transporter outer membrane subunit n=1 Tax=Nitrosomonas sp. Nm58 TaxID=200126 RepID=UPI0008995D73|nr:efflux transporter outer membrane subunit [Nitrosomonas sp. Nm58]SDY02777.1 outer membrane protein, multidrug efflux system [Nitrosomonas sp. Nm58]
MRRIVLPMLAAGLLTACAVGPDYLRPVIETPEKWRVDYPQAAAVANVGWWAEFGDPALNALIETALHENRDIQAAAARVDQFIGALQTTRAQFYPQIGYNADASRNRATERGLTPLPPGTDPYYALYRGALNASWQIDLFGRIRRQSEAAQALVFASEQGRRGVILSVVTSVAASYIGLRALDRQLEIVRASAANYANTLRIFELRYQGGVVSQVELSQALSQYQLALSAIPSIEQQIVAQENLISILLGRNPTSIPRGSTIDELIAPAVPPDLPSTLLERRPDIVQAEQNLVAANANVGVAKSFYYPTITLTGLLGSASTAFGNFLTGPASTWSVAAGLAGPIFTFGAIEGQVKTAEAAQQEALAFYQAIILNAFRETNDALIGAVKRREEAEAQAKRAMALKEYARLSRLKFDNGYADYIEVLYSENELFNAELTAVRSKAARYTELVNVYKATGGGWIDEAEKLAPKPRFMTVKPVREDSLPEDK